MLYNAQEYKQMPEEIFSKKNSMADDGTLCKKLCTLCKKLFYNIT